MNLADVYRELLLSAMKKYEAAYSKTELVDNTGWYYRPVRDVSRPLSTECGYRDVALQFDVKEKRS